jgi:hypothetical protein
MNLYDRDYRTLLPDEEALWKAVSKRQSVKFGEFHITRGSIRDFPKAARHYIHLFPNNYLDIEELKDRVRLKREVQSFRKLLGSSVVGERKLCNFINKRRTYFIIGSILASYYNFGHHEAYLFREFRLGTSHEVDYLLVGKSSDGWQFVFVELEAPTGKITTKDGQLGEPIRKGLIQTAAWEAWLQSNYNSLQEAFLRAKQTDRDLPLEFSTFDISRLHYVVIAGRRADFNETTYRIRRRHSTRILHYDNLIDAANSVIGASTY